MKFQKWPAALRSVLACTGLFLAMPFLLTGCNGFWAPPTGGGTTGGGTTATTLSSGNFYVINQATSQLAAYNINAGKLSQIGASPLAAAPIAIAMAPGGKFLYVSSVAGVFLYSIGANGALTVGNSGNVISSDPASALAVDPSGAWLIDAVQGSSGVQLDATPINASGAYTGATVGSEQYALANASVHQIAVSGDERYVFVAAGQGGTLVVPFSAGSSNPLGTSARSTGPLVAGGSALSVAVDPGASPRLLYIGETLASGGNSGGLRVLNYSSLGTASLTEVANSPFSSGGTAPNAILPVAGGDNVYVASGAGPSAAGSIAGFSIVDTSGVFTVTKVSTVSTGELPAGLAEDNQSHFVLAVSSAGNSDLECYFFDTATAGKLDDTINANTGTDPTEAVGIAAAP
jgi:6-phosphogluconolactonase (cycloisomerase 2 family)